MGDVPGDLVARRGVYFEGRNRHMMMRFITLIAAFLGTTQMAFAQTLGQPTAGAYGMQESASKLMDDVITFNNWLVYGMTAIVIFVLFLLLYVMWRFSEKRNPNPSRTTHHVLLEVAWTIVPILILLVIAVPSFKLLYDSDKHHDAEMTIKATGYQWYWGYEYPDHGGFSFDAVMLQDDELTEEQKPLRLLLTDNAMVVPAGVKIRLQVTSEDVIHAWAMPATGIKVDGIPGRLNEIPIFFREPGMYYGQCSELCGKDHGFMPITVKVVTKEEFAAWVEKAKVEFADNSGAAPVRLAQTALK